MGFETKASLQGYTSFAEVRQAIVDSFVSKEWRIVRDQGDCFSVAFKERKSTTWDEDFVVCVNGCIKDSVYLLNHMDFNTETVHTTIEKALENICSPLVWDEV